MVLGRALGFTYRDSQGRAHEVKGGTGTRLAVTPSKRTLAIVGRAGVVYVMEGGNMRVEDWIRD